MPQFLDRYFRIPEHGSTVRAEVLGGLTTFATMAYIVVVNPAILQAIFPADIGLGPLTVATILTCVFGSLLMGLYANRPIAVAPYMGENAFIAFTLSALLIGGQRVTWQQALGVVFVSGLAFLVLTLVGLRQWLAGSISRNLRLSFAAGIGLFLMFVGFTQTGLVVHGAPGGPPVRIGDLRDLHVLLAVLGFVLITTLLYWKVRGGILIGIVAVGLLGYSLGLAPAPDGVVAWPFSARYDVRQVALHLDLRSVFDWAFFPVLFTLFLISFLDTIGTLMAVGVAGDMLDDKGNFPRMERPMLVDSLACVFAGLVGTSTSGAFIESTTGVREGARTGLAAVVAALLFAVTLFFIPLVEPFQQLAFAYGPALMAVGVLMIGSVTRIDFDDLSEAVPALATIAMILFTFNIANGLTAGLVLHPVFKLLTARWNEITLGSATLGLMCLAYFLFGMPH